MFGGAYFAKVPVAKALSELEQFKVTEHDQLQAFDPPVTSAELGGPWAAPGPYADSPPPAGGTMVDPMR